MHTDTGGVRRRSGRTTATAVALGLLVAAGLGSAAAQTVTPGQQPRTADVAAVRFKSLANTGSAEIYLGIPSLGVGGNRTETNAVWVDGANAVTFTLDVANDRLQASISNSHPNSPFLLEYPNLSSQITALVGPGYGVADISMMEIQVRLGHATGTISFDGVAIDGDPLGSFAGVLNSTLYWTVTDYDFYDAGAGFTLTGTVQRGGTYAGGDEATRIEIVLGITECGNGALEAGEACDDGDVDAGDCCSPTCAFEIGACDDGSICTTGETCDGAGTCLPGAPLDCDDGSACTADACDPGSGCVHVGAPVAVCQAPGRAVLSLRDEPGPSLKDRLAFKWLRSSSPPTIAELSDPTTTAGYSLCVFAGTAATVLVATDVAPVANWRAIGGKGFRFRDPLAAQDGIRRILLRGDASRKPRAIVRGRGLSLPPLPGGALPLDPGDFPLRAQLINTANGECLEATFDASHLRRNSTSRLRLKRLD